MHVQEPASVADIADFMRFGVAQVELQLGGDDRGVVRSVTAGLDAEPGQLLASEAKCLDRCVGALTIAEDDQLKVSSEATIRRVVAGSHLPPGSPEFHVHIRLGAEEFEKLLALASTGISLSGVVLDFQNLDRPEEFLGSEDDHLWDDLRYPYVKATGFLLRWS